LRVEALTKQSDWKTLKDDIQTVASASDIISDDDVRSDLEYVESVRECQSCYIDILKKHIDPDILPLILDGNPEIELEPEHKAWVLRTFRK
jgi:hypothetical protein